VREIRVPFSHFSLCKAALDCPWPSSTTLPGQRQLSASHAVFRRCQASARYATPAGSNAISPIARSTSGAAIPRARGPPRCGRRNSRLAIPTPTPSGTIDSSGAQGRCNDRHRPKRGHRIDRREGRCLRSSLTFRLSCVDEGP